MSKTRVLLVVSTALVGCGSSPKHAEMVSNAPNAPASPLVDRGRVIVHVGGHNQGALTAYEITNGDLKWTWTGDGPSYASPIVADIGGVRQVITQTQENIIGVSAIDGRLLWRRPFSTEYTQNIITPIVLGNTVIVAGYQKPTSAFRIVKMGDQWRTEDVWENPAVSLYMANAVVVGDATEFCVGAAGCATTGGFAVSTGGAVGAAAAVESTGVAAAAVCESTYAQRGAWASS